MVKRKNDVKESGLAVNRA